MDFIEVQKRNSSGERMLDSKNASTIRNSIQKNYQSPSSPKNVKSFQILPGILPKSTTKSKFQAQNMKPSTILNSKSKNKEAEKEIESIS